MRKETGSRVTGDIFVASKHHSPLHKLGLAEKVLENTRQVKLKRTHPRHAIVCLCVCITFRMEYPVHPERGIHGVSDAKEFACNARDLGLIAGLGRCPGVEKCNPLQYSCLEKYHRQGNLVVYSLWGHKELDTTD